MASKALTIGVAVVFGTLTLGSLADAAPKKPVHRRPHHSTRVTRPDAPTSGSASANARKRPAKKKGRSPKLEQPSTAPTVAPSSTPTQHRQPTKPH